MEFWKVHRCQKLNSQWEQSTWEPYRDRIMKTLEGDRVAFPLP